MHKFKSQLAEVSLDISIILAGDNQLMELVK